MLYIWLFGCHGNMCYIIFIDAFFCMIHSIGAINVCTNFEINRYKNDEFRKAFVLFDVCRTSYFHRGSDTSDWYFDQEHFKTNQKSLRLLVKKLWLKEWFS